jgi:hypothetical protein
MVYADAPRVTISNIIPENITSTSVDLVVMYSGVKTVYICRSDTPDGFYNDFYTEEAPSEGVNYMSYNISGLLPNTTYYMMIEVVSAPDPDDPTKFNRARSYVSFTTESAPE